MRLKILAPLAVVAVALLAGADSLFVVSQTQQALVVRFGEPVRIINAGPNGQAAGLYLKWPLADHVLRFDRRNLALQGEASEVMTADQHRLEVQPALHYRITDPLRFYQTAEDGGSEKGRLQALLDGDVSRVLQGASAQDIVSDRRDALMQTALTKVQAAALADRLGIKVLDVALVDVSPPADELQAVEQRMQADEAQEAGAVRAQGEADKATALAAADREAADIRGEGERVALTTRGDGDAQRAAILGDAYGKDADFARFFRRLEAYDQAINPQNTTLVLSADNDFLELFGHGPGVVSAR